MPSVLFSKSLIPLHRQQLPARQARRLHTATVALARRGLAELLQVRRESDGYAALKVAHLFRQKDTHSVHDIVSDRCRGSSRTPLKQGHISPRLEVPEHIMRPPYVKTEENPWIEQIQVHNAQVWLAAFIGQGFPS